MDGCVVREGEQAPDSVLHASCLGAGLEQQGVGTAHCRNSGRSCQVARTLHFRISFSLSVGVVRRVHHTTPACLVDVCLSVSPPTPHTVKNAVLIQHLGSLTSSTTVHLVPENIAS